MLVLAAQNGGEDGLRVIKIYLRLGADINFLIDNSFSALHIAIQNGNFEVVEFFLSEDGRERSENVLGLNKPSSEGLMPLDFAVMNRKFDYIKPLLECGADVTRARPEHHNIIRQYQTSDSVDSTGSGDDLYEENNPANDEEKTPEGSDKEGEQLADSSFEEIFVQSDDMLSEFSNQTEEVLMLNLSFSEITTRAYYGVSLPESEHEKYLRLVEELDQEGDIRKCSEEYDCVHEFEYYGGDHTKYIGGVKNPFMPLDGDVNAAI